jgi:hypothetical protein
LFTAFSHAISVQKKAEIISINIKLKKKNSKLSRTDAQQKKIKNWYFNIKKERLQHFELVL